MVEFQQKGKGRVQSNMFYWYFFVYCAMFGIGGNSVVEYENGGTD